MSNVQFNHVIIFINYSNLGHFRKLMNKLQKLKLIFRKKPKLKLKSD